MSEPNETVREVCAEQLELPTIDRNQDWQVACLMFRDEVQRMKREMAAKDAEIARLKAALKPVMSVGFRIPRGHGKSGMIHFKDILELNRQDAVDSVREAQRIMKEGESND